MSREFSMVWQSQDMYYIPCAGQLLQVPEWPLLACFLCVCALFRFPQSNEKLKNGGRLEIGLSASPLEC